MTTPDRRILPSAQTILVDRAGRATQQLYDFFRRLISATQLTPELITQIQDLLVQVEQLQSNSGGFLPISANVLGQQSVVTQGTLSDGTVLINLFNDTSGQQGTWYYGTGPTIERGWHRFFTALTTGAGLQQRNSGYIELGEVNDPADLPGSGNAGEAYWVRGFPTIADRGLWAWDGAAWSLDAAATGVVSFEIANDDYGDITVTANGATWTIDNNAVSNAKLRDSAGLSVIGRASDTAGDPADIVAAVEGAVLRRIGNALGFSLLALNDLEDVALSAPATHDALMYDETAEAWGNVPTGPRYLAQTTDEHFWDADDFVRGHNIVGVRYAGPAVVHLPHDLPSERIIVVKDEAGAADITIDVY